MARISAPIFAFGDSDLVKTTDEYLRSHAPGRELAMASSEDAELLASLQAGAAFDVLDMTGGWAWGEVPGGSGPVGYIALDQLERCDA